MAVSARTAKSTVCIISEKKAILDEKTVGREQAPSLSVPTHASRPTINGLSISTGSGVSAKGGVQQEQCTPDVQKAGAARPGSLVHGAALSPTAVSARKCQDTEAAGTAEASAGCIHLERVMIDSHIAHRDV